MNSKKLSIIIAVVSGILVLLPGGALLLVKILVTPEMLRKNVLPRVEKLVQRRIEMGDAKIGLFSGIALKGLKIYEKDGKGLFVSFAEARLHYQFLPLLSRRVVVDEVVLDTPDVHVVRNLDGSFNFSDLLKKKHPEVPPAEKEKTPFTFAVAKVEVTDGQVRYDDRKGIFGSPFSYNLREIGIEINNLTPDKRFPLEIKAAAPGVELEFSGTLAHLVSGPSLDGQLTASIADLAKAVSGLPPGISAKLRALSPTGKIAANVHLAGEVKAPLALLKDGEAQLEGISLAAAGQNPVISGTVALADRALTSRNLIVVLGKNRLDLQLKTSPLDKKPLALALNANSESLDLDPLTSAKKAKAASSPSKPGADSTGPGPLKLPLTLSGAVTAKALTFKGLAMSGVSLRYRLADSILTVEDLKGGIAGGTFLDATTVNLGTRGFAYTTRLSLHGVQAEKIVAAFAPKAAGSVSGVLSAKAALSVSGATPASLKRNLTGSGSFELKNGKLSGSGFMGELAAFLGSPGLRVVRFSSFAGTYRIKGGQVYLDSALDGSDIRMRPQGRIGFDKSLDLDLDTQIAPRITGTVARGTVGSFVTNDQGWGEIPLKATGTVGKPRFSLSGNKLGRRIGEKLGETLLKKLDKGTGTGQPPGDQDLGTTIRGLFGR
ncbi:MAG: AsmA family protein [Deltaproteobacteria bacterium]|nr:AsmA family protein [Deltaproteobacteria bacterium]TLN05235.1 MAG: AsmA family protein [bacterium]